MLNLKSMSIELGRVLRFGVTGIVSALAYVVGTFCLIATGTAGPLTAAVIGYTGAAAISYFGHLYFSFRVDPDHRTFLWRFAAIVAVNFSMTMMITYIVTNVLAAPYHFSIAVVAVLIPATSYLCNRFWVFLPGFDHPQGRPESPSRTA